MQVSKKIKVEDKSLNYLKDFDIESDLEISLNSIVANIKLKSKKFPIVTSKKTTFLKVENGNIDKVTAIFQLNKEMYDRMKSIEEKCLSLMLGKKFKGWDVSRSFLKHYFHSSLQKIESTEEYMATFTINEAECAFFKNNGELDDSIFCISNDYFEKNRQNGTTSYQIVVRPYFIWFVSEKKMGMTWKIIQIK